MVEQPDVYLHWNQEAGAGAEASEDSNLSNRESISEDEQENEQESG